MESNRVISLGWFGHRNCGDEAFKDALLLLFPDIEFTFISNLRSNLNLINNSRHLLIGGGNIVSKEFLSGLDEIKIPYSFIGVGLTENSPTKLLKKAEVVLVRDRRSLDLYKDAIYSPDITFSMKLNNNIPDKVQLNTPTVGVFLNDCVSARFDSTILKFIEAEKAKLELSRFLEHLPYNILFIPMSFSPPDDRRISLDVIGKMFKGYKYNCLTEIISSQECLNLISKLDFAVTMRLHASVFCTIAGIPFIDLLHHDKNRGYLETNGITDLGLDYYELSIKSLNDKFSYLKEDRERISNTLLQISRENKRLLKEATNHVHLPQRREDLCSK